MNWLAIAGWGYQLKANLKLFMLLYSDELANAHGVFHINLGRLMLNEGRQMQHQGGL